jgi:hypothetical protein
MIRKLRALGLAIGLALTCSATMASGASALTFQSESYPATLTSSAPNAHTLTFAPGVRSVSCGITQLNATLSASTTTLKGLPSFFNCVSNPGGVPVTIEWNGCDFTLHPTSQSGSTSQFDTTLDCPAGQRLRFRIFASAAKHVANETMCVYEIDPQGPIAGTSEADAEGAGKTRDLMLTLQLEEIATTITQGTKLLCGGTAGTTVGAKYAGPEGTPAKLTLKAENAKSEQIGLFIA